MSEEKVHQVSAAFSSDAAEASGLKFRFDEDAEGEAARRRWWTRRTEPPNSKANDNVESAPVRALRAA